MESYISLGKVMCNCPSYSKCTLWLGLGSCEDRNSLGTSIHPLELLQLGSNITYPVFMFSQNQCCFDAVPLENKVGVLLYKD
ncbi:hypothetical protein XENTR_v10017634 [Xenopus tropicalis]|nr:hypothetical protein XENTR_v10017634 [Xenopus tropicalis]